MLGLLCATAVVLAATPLDGPMAAVKEVLKEATTIVTGEGTHNQKLHALRILAGGLLDTQTMGRRAIGAKLSEQTTAQQEEFLELFDELIVRAYLQKLLFFENPVFDYVGEERTDPTAKVYTKILTKKDEFYVDYDMNRNGDRWVATDVIVERASLTRNYRRQFSRLLRDQSFEELLERMRGKITRLRKTDDEE
jgi:phospholipid transport system substrate-binding protein